jgi:hypothetical protein
LKNYKKDDFYIPNPFRSYVYEVPGSFRKFVYSSYGLSVRTNRYDEGYEEITNLIKIEALDEIPRLRLLPFCSYIDDDFFIENIKEMSYNDWLITRQDKSNKLELLNKLHDTDDPAVKEKITEDEFMNNFIHGRYYNSRQITFDDIVSFSIEIVYDYSDDKEIELIVSDLVFKEESKVIRFLDTGPNYHIFPITNIAAYYFTSGQIEDISFYLDMEILISLPMIFEYNFYQKMIGKVSNLIYDAVGGRW